MKIKKTKKEERGQDKGN